MKDATPYIERGAGALADGAWDAARDAFEAALEEEETPEAHYGLGDARWWLGGLRDALFHFERAYVGFRRRPDPALAAGVALRIAFDCRKHLGNEAAADGWLARAERLIDEHDLEGLRGDLLLMKANAAGDPVSGEGWARKAHELARRSGNLDLELRTLSQLGASLVEQGRVEEGVPLLDEAVAASLGGEPDELGTVVFTSCNVMISCVRCAALEKAMQWARAAERFAERYGCPFLYVECRTVYGAVLFAQGDWPGAERELDKAIELSRDTLPRYHAEALAAFAELRLAQGRIEEAERLLVDIKGNGAAVPVLARIHLACGRPEVAAGELRRRLDVIDPEAIESVLLLELLGRAEVALGEREEGLVRGKILVERGSLTGCSMALARGHRLCAQALVVADLHAGRRHFDTALAGFMRLGMPYESALTRLMTAEASREEAPGIAAGEAEAALRAFEQLGARRDADRTAGLLRELGIRSARSGPRLPGSLTRRERQVLALLGEGLSNPEIAKRLFISRKTVEHHVSSVLCKLGAKNRAEAAAEAVLTLGEVAGER